MGISLLSVERNLTKGEGWVYYNCLSHLGGVIGWFYHGRCWSIIGFTLLTAGAPVPDSFIDGYSPTLQGNGSKDTREAASRGIQLRRVADIFDAITNFVDEKLIQKVNAVFEFHLTGKEPGVWYLDLKSSTGEVGKGSFSGDEVNSTIMLDSEDFVKLFTGELNPAQAYLGGKLQITGSMHKFMRLENQLLHKMKSKL